MTPRLMALMAMWALVAVSLSASAQCSDVYNDLPLAPTFPTTQYPSGQTPQASALIRDHWSEKAQMFRPPRITPLGNPAQTSCPHLTGPFVNFHDLGYASGADITLPANTKVLVHSCSVNANTVFGVVTVPATSQLIFGDAPIQFQAKSIKVLGQLLAGSETCRLRNKVTITLHGKRSDQALPADNWVKGIYVDGGVLELHGAQYTPTWTRLAKSILPGDSVLFIQDMVNWEVGQTILVATTELKDSRDYNRNEERVITAIYSTIHANVAAIEVSEPFEFKHFAGKAYQAEVALLSRRILIQGDAVGSEPTDKDGAVCYDEGESSYPCNDKYLTGFGAHVRVEKSTGVGRFEGVELFRVGQTNQLGKYALHYHMIGQTPPVGRHYVKDCSVHRSYFRAYAIHGTNNVVVSQNVAYDVIGHAYFLEDGVEENNTFEYNFGAHVHWLGNSQLQSTDQWFWSQGLYWVNESPNMILPSDSTASVFYITNSNNKFLGNSVSGGWAGFAFPNLPKAVKLHENYKSGKFTPSSRPLQLFKGNVAHSTAYWFQSAGGFYVGGTLRHKTPGGILEYTGGRDGDRSTCAIDPQEGDQGGYCNRENELFMVFEDTKIFLANRGAQHWGSRSEVIRAEVHDVGMSMNVFGRVFLTEMLIQCRSLEHMPVSTCPSGSCSRRDQAFTNTFNGFQWYDVGQNHIMTKTEFRNCDSNYPHCYPKWEGQEPCNGASVFLTLTHSNEFVPEVMQASKQITFTNYDPSTTLKMTVKQTAEKQTVSGRLTNWIDEDGSVFPDAIPGQRVILGSYWANKWWRTNEECMGPKNDMWICPRNEDSVATLYIGYNDVMEGRIGQDADNCPNGDGECVIVGQVTHFGRPLADGLKIAQNPKVTGPIVKSAGGWFVQFNDGTPKTVKIRYVTVHPDDILILAFPYPRGTTFTVTARAPYWCSNDWARCQDTLVAANSLAEVRAAYGDKYYYDLNAQVLYYRVVQTDDFYWESNTKDFPHEPWPKRALADLSHFSKDGITIMAMDSYYFSIEIVANCAGGTALNCPKVANVAVPPAFAPTPAVTPRTFAPSKVRTQGPTTKAPSVPCGQLYDQCVNNNVESCCQQGLGCVKESQWWGACQPCQRSLGQTCGAGTTCCKMGMVCSPATSKCIAATQAPFKVPTGAPVTLTTGSPAVSTDGPTRAPTTKVPTAVPTSKSPTAAPTSKSPTTKSPTLVPTKAPTKTPTFAPTKAPSATATAAPVSSKGPTKAPTSKSPTKAVTKAPTKTPTKVPTKAPTKTPTKAPTKTPTKAPTKTPTKVPTKTPTKAPTSKAPTKPTFAPTSKSPTKFPTKKRKRGLADDVDF